MYHERQSLENSRKSWTRSVFLVETGPPCGLSVPRDWPSWTGNSGWPCSEQKQSSRPASPKIRKILSRIGTRKLHFFKGINRLHFFDPYHCFRRKIRTGRHLIFESCLPSQKWLWIWELSNCTSYICCLCCPTIEFCGNSTRITELKVDGLPAHVGIGNCLHFVCHLLWWESLSLLRVKLTPRSPCGAQGWIPWWCSGWL